MNAGAPPVLPGAPLKASASHVKMELSSPRDAPYSEKREPYLAS